MYTFRKFLFAVCRLHITEDGNSTSILISITTSSYPSVCWRGPCQSEHYKYMVSSLPTLVCILLSYGYYWKSHTVGRASTVWFSCHVCYSHICRYVLAYSIH
eukprot:jgi/Botrbrau1/15725/Bobra.4_1s0094.1